VDWISEETPDSGWQEPIAGAQQLVPDSDEGSSEPAFRPEWVAQFAESSNNSVNHSDESPAKDYSWPTDIDQYANVDGPSADNSLWQFYEHLRAIDVTGAMPPRDGTDGAATGGHHDGAELGSASDGTDLTAHAASVPVGSSTPPSIVMGISILPNTGDESFNEVASPTTSFLSSTFDNPFQFRDLPAATALPASADAHAHLNSAPVVWINHPYSPTGEWSHVGDWVSYSDADGNPAVQYQFRDDGLAPNSAYLSTPSNTHVPDGTTLTVAATDLTNVLVHSGDPNTSDTVWVRASDGSNWSAWAPIDFATTASGQAYGSAVASVPPPSIFPTLGILASPGPDTFVFNQNSIGLTIVNFDPSQDIIQFEGTSLTDFASVLSHTTDDGHGNTVIAYDAHNAVTLQGVTPAMLHPSDFHIL
jgi:hypothetical protein